ncbi:MAG: cytochrome o ubiquinol oxidase subunit IV [Candidatus Saccharimonadales bacterium]|jgi:cytochrome o ubiquinol oxidase operon protein cyoD
MKNYIEPLPAPAKNDIRSYIAGLTLSLVLTVSAFMLTWAYVQSDRQLFTRGWLIAGLALLACTQVAVQAVYFLHMSAARKARWTLASTIFTLLVVLTIVFGSIWVMQNLHYNMMPHMEGSTEHMQIEENIQH